MRRQSQPQPHTDKLLRAAFEAVAPTVVKLADRRAANQDARWASYCRTLDGLHGVVKAVLFQDVPSDKRRYLIPAHVALWRDKTVQARLRTLARKGGKAVQEVETSARWAYAGPDHYRRFCSLIGEKQ